MTLVEQASWRTPPDAIIIKPPRPIHPEHRMDFLTAVLPSGEAEFQEANPDRHIYQLWPAAHRKVVREVHVTNGMTRYMLGGLLDKWDGFANPEALVPFMQELNAEGLGVVLAIGPEDQDEMQAKYSPLSVFLKAMTKALAVWRPHISELWLGVEADEIWSANEILMIANTARLALPDGTPIVVHLLSGNVIPRDTTYKLWWHQARRDGVTHFAYQANHPKIAGTHGAFLADPSLIRAELQRAKDSADGQVEVISGEYAYFGVDPTPSTIQFVRTRGFELGDKSLEEVGGISNGGPGYFPSTVVDPIGQIDDIDVSQVRFWSTHPYVEITSTMRKWVKTTDLKPFFYMDGEMQVSYEHSQRFSWKPFENGANAASWLVLNRGAGWEAYTNDWIKPGRVHKPWKNVNSFSHEPITWGPPARGEQLYLMVSRPDPRRNNFQYGAERSQLVRVIAP